MSDKIAGFSDLKKALDILADAAEAVVARGQPAPILTGGAFVALLSSGAIMSGDIDLISSNTTGEMLREELIKRGFEIPSGPGALKKGWGSVHPELGIGVETVASRPMDGRAETREVILENGKHLRVLSVEDVIADRVGQSYMLG